MSRPDFAAMSQVERAARREWADAAHVHYAPCGVCDRTRDENGQPLLVARQRRRRVFECLECWDARQ